MFVMLFISVMTQIPELNLARLFSLEIDSSNDPERQLLAESTNNSTSYTRQIDDEDNQDNGLSNRITVASDLPSSKY